MPSFETTVTEIRDSPQGGFIVILKPHELETTTNLKEVLLEPKFANAGGRIHHDHIELYCDERPPIHEGQVLMVRSLDPHGTHEIGPENRFHAHRQAEVRRIEHQPVTEVNPDVTDVGKEEDQIAGLQVTAGHMHA